jgi:hypothetical protein
VVPSPLERQAWRTAVQPVTEAWRKARPGNERIYDAFNEELARVRSGG